ncbi:hypothetical protein SK128_008767 [Halocaridina rubra]|uniref:CUB domain-containing protein n=1 Tax=Halocaridina rubra TaxID=373956 RepID=A0AAN9A0M3_HALRR
MRLREATNYNRIQNSRFVNALEATSLATEDSGIQPRPHGDTIGSPDDQQIEYLDGFQPESGEEDRYVAYCTEAIVYMWPGNKRKFWSWGYMYLKTAYPANCTLKYTFTTRAHPSDTFAKYGFKITGTFEGPNVVYSTCSDTDYVTIDDTEGISQTYCGISSSIDFTTGSNYIEFSFKSQENSPGAKGFFVTIESYYLCGGLRTSTNNGPSGYIASPEYAADYPPNTNCMWWFTSEEETTIKLDCLSFRLEDPVTFSNGTTYCNDFMSISYEARTPSTTTFYCDSDMDTQARTIYSAGTTMLVNFRSDSANHYSGINCTYDFILYSV